MEEAYAHRDGFDGKPHGLIPHLRDVAAGARSKANAACPQDPEFAFLAATAGWLHDVGKFRGEFQEYLFGRRRGGLETRHSVFGAAGACLSRFPTAVVLAILGHHAGLHDIGDLQDQLKDPALNPLKTSMELVARLNRDCPELTNGSVPPLREFIKRGAKGLCVEFEDELRIRMLFSCLVDADYLDTERYMTGRTREPIPFQARVLFERLDAYVRRLSDGAEPTPVNRTRREVYDACVAASAFPPGCFSLTAPTGAGKTLAAMAFALKHAEKHGLRRVIVVLPFLAIIEQNARVYRKALTVEGDPVDLVLEHHSAIEGAEEIGVGDTGIENETQGRVRAKQATENWDAPVIVTTAVQFLESLFSRRPGRCRKLHHIAQSVVLFDEVQTLPFSLLDPILSVVRDLRSHFGVSVLLGSATLPSFGASSNLPSGFKSGECRELTDDPQRTFGVLRRARLELPFLQEGRWTWDQLAQRLKSEPRALVVVNLRKDAQDLYDCLRNQGVQGLFHLSSTMCPAHREAVLGKKDDPKPGTIYHALRLRQGGPCLVVSTQVVEAGVDLDFPTVFRAIGPLDAIIQAAGRCDREGLLTQLGGAPGGRVVVFEPADGPVTPHGFYEEATKRTRLWLAEFAANPDRLFDDPKLFADFHRELIAWGIGREAAQEIQHARNAVNFKKVDRLFKMIGESGQGVVVSYGNADALLESIRRRGFLSLDDRRRLQRFVVNLFPQWITHLGAHLRPVFGSDEGLLHYEGLYDKDALGIRLGELPPEQFLI
ncbi:CRISPR-associated helicase, Cas3 family [Singulisphaera sp. GP187]|uniref:CRISPR-associated helicase/endonuclease Cas3 n=1 Tax=Singulisphaera sp. GP187 TaxID=1882752 RepID=UPI000925BE01|nr:CRISPR-associated helicase/endonuclease Cas3 [Singulisphaera sp. GP187]SIO46546.1 CRISPR-associated helicase, Cas3 family [Singulisphaera sp. GP187]